MQFLQKYKILQQLPSNNSDEHYKIISIKDQKKYMLKKVHYSKMQQKQKQQIVQQVNILTQINSNYLVKYYQHFVHKTQNTLYIVMEHQSIDLQQILKKYENQKKIFSQDKIWKLFKQIVLALKDIHKNKKGIILHRNIQPKSIFINNTSIKLGNFKFVKKLDDQDQFATTLLKDSYYMSPQQLQQGIFTTKSDIWALGCLLYQISTFTNPFQGTNNIQIAKKVKQGKVKSLPSCYKKQLNRVIRWCLAKDPKDRPSVEDLLGVPMINLLIRQNRLTQVNKKIIQKQKKTNILQQQINKIEEKIQFIKSRDIRKSLDYQINNKQNFTTLNSQNSSNQPKKLRNYETNLKSYDLQLKRGISDKINDKLNDKWSLIKNLSTNSSQLTNYTTIDRCYTIKGHQKQHLNIKKGQSTHRHLNF